MTVTAKAKAAFSQSIDDLYARGRRLVRESLKYGVTSMRAHVEVDTTVGFSCLDVGLRLREEWKSACDIQIAAFMQDPLFVDAVSTEPGPNYALLEEASARDGVSVVGSAPYVEPSIQQAKQNINILLKLSQKRQCHVDFHLD